MKISELNSRIISIRLALKRMPKRWSGKKAILEMKNGGSKHWRQMEWIGFYFEFLCGRFLRRVAKMPGPKYGRTAFDAFDGIPWDFKAHATNTSSHGIIVNDREAIVGAIKKYGHVGVILAVGDVVYNDEKRTFQRWHQELKGGISKYEKERVRRGAWSRLRKVSFRLREVALIALSEESLKRTGSFQKDFRNSNGNLRRVKVSIDLEKLDKKEIIGSVKFR